ncbi:MAG: DNA translocase FtsK, partial [Asticcacaulis sp.]
LMAGGDLLMDTYYSRAVELVTTDRKTSTSYIQRRLQIGYNTAAALMERMETEGIVSPANENGKRDILVGPGFQPPPQTDHVADTGKMIEPAEAPAPEAKLEPDTEYTGPMARFTCASCDTLAEGPANGLPKDWYSRESALLGTLHNCAGCSEKNAVKIATSNMTTEQIISAGKDGADTDVITAAAQGRLKTFIERLERLFEDVAALQADVKEVRDEAKGEGFDTKIIMRIVRERRKDKIKREEEDALFDLYVASIGGL